MTTLFEIKNQSEYQMDSNLSRRMRNFNLSPDQYLMPLFEAISNSIHAIQDRFSKNWQDKGWIKVEFIKENGSLKKIIVSDNGIGLNDYNFDSFLKTDSDYKKERGGKGIGRFSWLLVFSDILITSNFMRNKDHFIRKFNFGSKEKPVYNHTLNKCLSKEQCTVLELSNIKKEFLDKYNEAKLDFIAKSTISHFILTMFAGVPDILFIDGDNELNIKEFWDRGVIDSKTEPLNEILGITITHLMLKTGLVSKNTLYISANYRSVDSNDIGNSLGLKNALLVNNEKNGEQELCYYVGVLSGELFDRAAYSERTGLIIAKDLLSDIIETTIGFLREGYLKPYYEQSVKERINTLQDVVNENPKFKYLVNNPEEFVKKLNQSCVTKTDIYKDLAVKDYQESKNIDNQVQVIISKVSMGNEVDINEVATKATQKNQAALAEYVKNRKQILDLLEMRRGWVDPDTKKNYLEKDIHNIVCPMKKDSTVLTIDDHNLWILDDRLAYYGYFASDENIKKYIDGSTSNNRPDIALFQGCNAFQRDNKSNQPVVIVEFKRPENDDYTDEENPIEQVLGYIEEFRNHKVRKPGGQLITTIDENTPFQCYIVCDITQNLKKRMRILGGFTKYPDGHGYRSYREEYRAMIDIIPFENLIEDAKLRNEIFFDKLGLLKNN